MKYQITLHGCDDSTSMDVELTAEEAKLIERLGELSKGVSSYQCMPILTIEKYAENAEKVTDDLPF